MMQIFVLLDLLSILLNIMATIYVFHRVSQMSLFEALCDSPGDCPSVFNKDYIVGIVVISVSAASVNTAHCTGPTHPAVPPQRPLPQGVRRLHEALAQGCAAEEAERGVPETSPANYARVSNVSMRGTWMVGRAVIGENKLLVSFLA